MFSVDFSLTYKRFKYNSLFKFDKFPVPSARGQWFTEDMLVSLTIYHLYIKQENIQWHHIGLYSF